jgi:hypothetical protein
MSGKTELKIFDDHPPQMVVESGYFEDVYPRTSLVDSNDIEFFIAASNVDYLDLNDTLLTIHTKVVKSDGTEVKQEDIQAIPAEYYMHSLFSDVTLSLNDTVIEGGAKMYPYKAAIENELNFGSDATREQLRITGRSENDKSRQFWAGNSKLCEWSGALRLDFLNQPKYLIPGVNVRILLTRSSADFVLSSDKDKPVTDGTWKIILSKAILYVRRVKVHPAVLKAHNLGLQTKNAIYPYTRTKLVNYSVPQGSTTFVKDNLFSSAVLPKLVVVCFVNSLAFSGSLKKSAIHFHHFNVSRVDLMRDGQSVPYRSGYTCDMEDIQVNDVYARSILQNLNLMNKNIGIALPSDRFTAGFIFFCFNLTPDFDLNERQPVRDSNLRLDLQFKKPLDEPINVIAYGLYDGTIQITNAREIIKDGFA